MNPWLKTAIVAVALAAVWCAVPFVLGWPDRHGMNWLIVSAAVACLASLLTGLLGSWLWHRRLAKKQSYLAACGIAAGLTFIVYAYLCRPMVGGWFWDVYPEASLFLAVFAGLPLVYFLACRKPQPLPPHVPERDGETPSY